jgi:hypothetical protein
MSALLALRTYCALLDGHGLWLGAKARLLGKYRVAEPGIRILGDVQ